MDGDSLLWHDHRVGENVTISRTIAIYSAVRFFCIPPSAGLSAGLSLLLSLLSLLLSLLSTVLNT